MFVDTPLEVCEERDAKGLYKKARAGIIRGKQQTCRKNHVMPREKDGELWTAVSGLLALISRAYHNFSLWHHKCIKADMSAALVVLN